MSINWKYGENKTQNYYEANVNGTYLLVFANKWNPDLWLGMIDSTMIYNKTKNDRQRKKQELSSDSPISQLYSQYILSGSDAEYMKRKVEQCFAKKVHEISA